VKEVRGSKASLRALHEQPALASENEERLLIRLGVVDAALAGLEDGHVDPERGNSTGESPYSFANQHAAPLVSDVNHSASRTLTTNQPSVTGASPEPASSSCASLNNRILAAQTTHPWHLGESAGMFLEEDEG
jgi:hypothetical protein